MKRVIISAIFIAFSLHGFSQTLSSRKVTRISKIYVYGQKEYKLFKMPVFKKEVFCNGQELPFKCRYERFSRFYCECGDSTLIFDDGFPIIRGCRGQTITYIDGMPVRSGRYANVSIEQKPIFYSGLSVRFESYNDADFDLNFK